LRVKNKIKILALAIFKYLRKLSIKYIADGCIIMSSSIAFYFLFFIFPFVLLLISLSGILINRFGVQPAILFFVEERIPIIYGFTESNIIKIVENRASIGITGFIFLILSTTYIFDSIQFSLNRIYKTKTQRRYWKQKIFGFLIMSLILIIVIISFLLSTSFFYLVNIIVDYFKLNEPISSPLFKTISIMLGLTFNFAIFSLIYFFGTNKKTHFKYHIYKGALFAAIAWELSKHIFIIYIYKFVNFELTYGSVGSIIGLLLWVYISSLILVMGAEINSLDLVEE
jgi:membrane protein